ncbi:hypothetical protein [Nocardia blacklockiae]|uniref:hypothetical protein n=1 Tax=Nocardia blacklockiae TaxID=480036 RepID=UPI001892E138|nr:hypothetical protein [Nocardia blacklockiae]MBF6172119.1 hypothetical protein [Nocardia blacklockiae]
MSRSLDVDQDLLRAVLAELSATADLARQDLHELQSVLTRQGEPWGHDEPGRAIGEAYTPQAEQSLTGYRNLVDNLHALSQGIADAADDFAQQDTDAGDLIRGSGADPGLSPLLTPSTYPSLSTPNPVATDPRQPAAVNPADYPANDTGPSAGTGPVTPSGGTTGPTQQPIPGYTPQSAPSSGQSPSATETPAAQSVPNQAASGSPAAPAGPTPPPTAGPQQSPTARPSANASPQRDSGSGRAGKNADTPWSRGGGPALGGSRSRRVVARPNSAGSPWSRPGFGGGRPQRISGPEPGMPSPTPAERARAERKSKAAKEKKAAAKKSGTPPTDPRALDALRALAERHDLRLAGFDTSGVGLQTVGEIAAALDELLGKYPFAELEGLEIAELGGRVAEIRWGRARSEPSPDSKPRLLLDRALVANPARLAVAARSDVRAGRALPETVERPIYSAVATAFGRILVGRAGPRPRRSAQRVLITEYHRISGPWSGRDTLAHVVGGYRDWRNQLLDSDFGGHDATGPLVGAFTEVELRGAEACGPAKVLHLLLVESARGWSDSR